MIKINLINLNFIDYFEEMLDRIDCSNGSFRFEKLYSVEKNEILIVSKKKIEIPYSHFNVKSYSLKQAKDEFGSIEVFSPFFYLKNIVYVDVDRLSYIIARDFEILIKNNPENIKNLVKISILDFNFEEESEIFVSKENGTFIYFKKDKNG